MAHVLAIGSRPRTLVSLLAHTTGPDEKVPCGAGEVSSRGVIRDDRHRFTSERGHVRKHRPVLAEKAQRGAFAADLVAAVGQRCAGLVGAGRARLARASRIDRRRGAALSKLTLASWPEPVEVVAAARSASHQPVGAGGVAHHLRNSSRAGVSADVVPAIAKRTSAICMGRCYRKQ
jgi:hypothetical protein